MSKNQYLGLKNTLLCLLVIVSFQNLNAQKRGPTVVFYAAYIFEAKTNGDTLAFPLMPGETAITTLDNFSETAQGYIEKFRSIYSFDHFTLITTMGGAFSIGLTKGDGSIDKFMVTRDKKHVFYLSISSQSDPEAGLLPIRIDAQLDTTTKQDQKFPDTNRIYLFKTLCTVKDEHPLVIGRPLFSRGYKRAIFFVFTPFFQQLTHANQYDKIVDDYKRVLQLSLSKYDLGGKSLFQKINEYFETKLNKKGTLAIEDIIPQPPPPPPPQTREDIPVFVPYDEAPHPIGGYDVIQKKLIYPEIARKAGIEGRVMVWAKIDEQGNVIQTRILTSRGPSGCDEAAMAAVSAVKWKPAMRNDKPIKVWVAVPIDFRLK